MYHSTLSSSTFRCTPGKLETTVDSGHEKLAFHQSQRVARMGVSCPLGRAPGLGCLAYRAPMWILGGSPINTRARSYRTKARANQRSSPTMISHDPTDEKFVVAEVEVSLLVDYAVLPRFQSSSTLLTLLENVLCLIDIGMTHLAELSSMPLPEVWYFPSGKSTQYCRSIDT